MMQNRVRETTNANESAARQPLPTACISSCISTSQAPVYTHTLSSANSSVYGSKVNACATYAAYVKILVAALQDVSQEEDVDEKGDCYNSYDADRDGSDEEEETEDSDETAKDIDTGEEEESAKRVGGDGDFSDLTVCSTLHGVMRIEFALQYQKPALTLYDILAKNKQELLT